MRIEFFCHHLLVTFIFDPTTIFQMMKWDIGIPTTVDPGTGLPIGPDTPPPVFGTVDNSRGSYIKALVVQALGGPGELPGVPGFPAGDASADRLA